MLSCVSSIILSMSDGISFSIKVSFSYLLETPNNQLKKNVHEYCTFILLTMGNFSPTTMIKLVMYN